MKRTVKRVKIALNFQRKNVAELTSFADGIKLLNDPDALNPRVTDGDIKSQSAALKATHNSRQTDKSKATTNLERQQIDTLVESLIEDANYVEGVANKTANGDVAVAAQIITRIGFTVKKSADKHQRSFEVIDSGNGMIHLRVKALARREAVVRQYSPDVSNRTAWAFPVVTLESELIVTGLTSGTNYGFWFAMVLAVPGKPTVTAGTEEPKWSDIIFNVAP